MKPPVRDYIDFLEDISDGIAKVEQFIHGATFEQFAKDDKTFYGNSCTGNHWGGN